MNQLQLAATLTAAPSAQTDNMFPSGQLLDPFGLNPAQKPYNVDTKGLVQVNSPGAFVSIPGIGGAIGPVTQAQFLFVRTIVPIQVRITYSGDGVAKVSYISGILIVEADPNHPITLVEIQGSASVEYYAAGIM